MGREDENSTLDKTWQEIHDAFVSGSVRIQRDDGSVYVVGYVGYSKHEGYLVSTSTNEGYVAASASDYPVRIG